VKITHLADRNDDGYLTLGEIFQFAIRNNRSNVNPQIRSSIDPDSLVLRKRTNLDYFDDVSYIDMSLENEHWNKGLNSHIANGYVKKFTPENQEELLRELEAQERAILYLSKTTCWSCDFLEQKIAPLLRPDSEISVPGWQPDIPIYKVPFLPKGEEDGLTPLREQLRERFQLEYFPTLVRLRNSEEESRLVGVGDNSVDYEFGELLDRVIRDLDLPKYERFLRGEE